MDNILAKPADLCCLKGAFHTGEPTGSIAQIGGVDTYIAKPHPERSNGNVVLFFPDAFGLHISNFLMMDAFAECGYLTLGVDYFFGIKNVKSKYGTSKDVKFACVGYCWGARFVCQQLSAEGICKAGAIAHPSFLKERDIPKVDEPIFLSVPAEDKLFEPAERSRTVEILAEGSKLFNMQIFANVGHGFASRARLTDPYEKWAKEQSFKSFADWFDLWLPKICHMLEERWAKLDLRTAGLGQQLYLDLGGDLNLYIFTLPGPVKRGEAM
ncbi:dienelactone hydrolase [Aspergillus affinis]|uniref:dienelactone hydrolase n=1 Tax=Aspergillus affinis TaxID=1070780 RepID=UPI0022FE11B7|nr:dienelactone hydrolase [Aspergillus affinis]KAI9039898.1 dienelactone hydrolase [Aspergillus affinis]